AEASVGTVRTNIIAQIVGIYLQPAWATLEGNDKSLAAIETNAMAFGGGKTGFYTVPLGKTLYVTGIQAVCRAKNAVEMQ
ncbi:unnamed protein product, partial [marine sediment metagenome]